MESALNLRAPIGKICRLSLAVLFIFALVSPHRTYGATINRLEDEASVNRSSAPSVESATVGERITEASELELGTDAEEQSEQQLPSERAAERAAAADDSETARAFARRFERVHRHRYTTNNHHGSRSSPTAAGSLATRTPSRLHRGSHHSLRQTRYADESEYAAETPLYSSSRSRQRSRADSDLNRASAPHERQPTTAPQLSNSVGEVISGSDPITEAGERLEHQPPLVEQEDTDESEVLQRGRRCVIYADGSGRVRPGGRVKVARWKPSSPHYVLSMGKRSVVHSEGDSRSVVSTEGSAQMTHVCACQSSFDEDDTFDVCKCWSSHEAHNSSASQHVLILEGGARSGRLQCSCTRQSALRVCACSGPCAGARDGDDLLCLELHEVLPPTHHTRHKRDRSLIEALRRRHKPAGTHSRHAPSLYLQSLLNGALG